MSDTAPVDVARARLRALTSLVAREPTIAGALGQVGPDGTAALDLTAPGALRPFLAAALAECHWDTPSSSSLAATVK